MKWSLFYLLAGVLLVSCSAEPPKETVRLDEIIKRSDTYREGQSDTSVVREVQDYDRLSASLKNLLDSLQVKPGDLRLLDTLLFADRFGADTTVKLRWTGQSGESSLYYWEFADSNKVKNAFFNWLDCFGPDCTSHRLYENSRLDKRFTAIWVGSQSMYLFQTQDNSRFSADAIEQCLKSLSPDELWLYRVRQPARSTMRWYETGEDGKLKLIQKKHENS